MGALLGIRAPDGPTLSFVNLAHAAGLTHTLAQQDISVVDLSSDAALAKLHLTENERQKLSEQG